VSSDKVKSLPSARTWRGAVQGRVVFTNGVFDLLHPGHVALLERARAMGEALIVGVNDDASAQRLHKGPDRPIVPAVDRARVVAALQAVDCVVLFGDDTPEETIRRLEPDVLVKGSDYDPDNIPGREFVSARGGIVTTIPTVEGHSTTALVDQIRAATR
jgi:rfaE bifunctional protein nucleotidyltransferase chain/domain